MSEEFLQALSDVLGRWDIWLIVLASAVYGIFVGAIPGLTATMAVALFVPIAYWMDPVAALAAIVTMVACAIFSGDLPTVLLRIPGTPASAAYADDAYAFSKRGESERVLGLTLLCSAFGGLVGAVVMMLVGRQLARVASWFSVTEYFWLYLVGLACAVLVAHGPKSKALLSLLLGLFFSTIGLSAAHMEPRFTFGIPSLYQGISFIPAMIGLFGLSEVLLILSKGDVRSLSATNPSHPRRRWTAVLASTFREFGDRFRHHKAGTARSSLLGILVGMLPGAGADIASWVSFAASKRAASSKDLTETETEALHSIGDATTANNAALAGSWIPTLVFGIPGDSITAIVIGVLMMKNVTPGPQIFDEQSSLVFSIYLIFFLANLMLIPVGFLAIRLSGNILSIPRAILFPMIIVFCITGSFALNGSSFDVITMLMMGLIGFLLTRRGFPLGPVVLGIILGGPLEERFVQSLTASEGSPLGLVSRPLSMVLAFVFVGFVVAIWSSSRQERQRDSDTGLPPS
ncbi:Tripartite tricarboxylate transporter TctA family protein [Roseimaritima multifibrata]|uniref:Tripartite tricarboxylate transporter TctA family protein n=1 Tax=Roseimaritima multifibrata TaxID=1930274 RepID=A0A517MGB0_9BACT|nr:tripartite tricarboxylate transporter permease [Roseimaritima multifibrata]QDS93797.1 Tripartite tricarboxylate transporter TctA family protein [Roseimaritima multifibrata]